MNNQGKKLVSIIIPVHNAEEYIKETLDSVIAQSYRDLEIILVDDGSKDNSGLICDEYGALDSRIKVKHIENGGAAVARNVGILASSGKYVCFVDSDDIISNDYIEYLVNYLEKYKLDIMVCGYKKVYDRSQCISDNAVDSIYQMSGVEALEDMLYRKRLTSAPWCKLVLREIIINNMFPEGRLFEDLGCVYKWYAIAKRVGYSEKIGYYYFIRKNSCQHSSFNIKKWDLIEISNEIVDFVNCNFPERSLAAINSLFVSAIQTLRYIPKRQYHKKYLELIQIIKYSRKKVLFDREAKKTTRILAGISIFSTEWIRFMGKQYDYWVNRLKIRMKY